MSNIVGSHYPRAGSFEIIYNNKLIFSKLETRRWPETKWILNVISHEIYCYENNIESPNEIEYKQLNYGY